MSQSGFYKLFILQSYPPAELQLPLLQRLFANTSSNEKLQPHLLLFKICHKYGLYCVYIDAVLNTS